MAAKSAEAKAKAKPEEARRCPYIWYSAGNYEHRHACKLPVTHRRGPGKSRHECRDCGAKR